MLKDIIEWCEIFQCRLLIIGDENQLPSIGPGTCLKNMIVSEIFKQTTLVEIKRQNGLLMQNIKLMTTQLLTPQHLTDNTMKLLSIHDFINFENGMIESGMDTKTLDILKIKKLFADERLQLSNTKVLTYFKDVKYVCNQGNLNAVLQEMFNADGEVISMPVTKYKNKDCQYQCQYKEGDLIIRSENDYGSALFHANGECAHITSFNRGIVRIKYLDDPITFAPTEVSVQTLYDEFSLAYALTVHKSQGSQYENVVIFIDPFQFSWNKTALYTAISRAQKRCIIITTSADFASIQRNLRSADDKASLFMVESSVYDL